MAGSKVTIVVLLIAAMAIGSLAQCENPTAQCAFTFQPPGKPAYVPTFKLSKTNQNTAISGFLYHRRSGLKVQSASTNQDKGDCLLYPVQSNGKPGRCEKQVFFKGAGDGPQSYIHMDRVAQFPLTDKDLGWMRNRCVVLYLRNVQLSDGNWLNQNDNNPFIPTSRRCVVFKTA